MNLMTLVVGIPDRREDQGPGVSDPEEEPTEAASGLGRCHLHQEARFRHGLQRRIHPFAGICSTLHCCCLKFLTDPVKREAPRSGK